MSWRANGCRRQIKGKRFIGSSTSNAGGRDAHLATNMSKLKGNIYIVLAIADRENPYEVGRWWMPGKKDG
jgi:hypothetical protein